MTLQQELDLLVEALPEITPEKRYWLVRTQSGSLYDTFRANGFVALEHDELPLSVLSQIARDFREDPIKRSIEVRQQVMKFYEEHYTPEQLNDLSTRHFGLVANQISKFAFQMRRGDVVIIPSTNSDIISFGYITESHIGNFTDAEQRKMANSYILKRRVEWIRDIGRIDLDPYIYKLFFGHQALSEVGAYADIIERSINNFFILDDEAHLILDVTTRQDISAKDLFGFGFDIMTLVDDFAQYADLEISSNDIQVKINLNSPGKIDLKSKIKRTTVVAGILLFVAGGGLKSKSWSLDTPGVPGLIKAASEFLDSKQEREMKADMYHHYKDSLKINDPDDLIKMMKQVSDNKDLSK
jgi:restriction system protein